MPKYLAVAPTSCPSPFQVPTTAAQHLRPNVRARERDRPARARIRRRRNGAVRGVGHRCEIRLTRAACPRTARAHDVVHPAAVREGVAAVRAREVRAYGRA